MEMNGAELNFDWKHQEYEDREYYKSPSGSPLKRDWRHLQWEALALVVRNMEEGQKKYGNNTWRKDPISDHVAHVMEHMIAAHGVETDLEALGHMVHALTRLMFAVQLYTEELQNE